MSKQDEFWATLVGAVPSVKQRKRGYFHKPGAPHVGRKGMRGGSRKRPREPVPSETPMQLPPA